MHGGHREGQKLFATDTHGLTQTGLNVAGGAGKGLKTFWTRINADYTVGAAAPVGLKIKGGYPQITQIMGIGRLRRGGLEFGGRRV